MTWNEIEAIIPKDQKTLNKCRKNILRGLQIREVAWRAIWPFYKGTYSSVKNTGRRTILLLMIYYGIFYFFYELLKNVGIAFVLFIVFCVVRFILTFLWSKSIVNKNEKCLSEMSDRYTQIRDEYLRDVFMQYKIARYPSGYECTYNPKIKIYGQSNGTARATFRLEQDSGEISIYHIGHNYELPEEAKTDAKQDITDLIGSTEFRRNYQVRTTDQLKCMVYLSPTMQVAFNEHANLMYLVRPIQVRNNTVTVETIDCLEDQKMYDAIIFRYDNIDTIAEHFDCIDSFIKVIMILTKMDFLNKES